MAYDDYDILTYVYMSALSHINNERYIVYDKGLRKASYFLTSGICKKKLLFWEPKINLALILETKTMYKHTFKELTFSDKYSFKHVDN